MLYREIIAVCSQIHTKHIEMVILSNKVATHAAAAAPLLAPVASFHQHPTSRLSGQLCTRDKDRARHLWRSGLTIRAVQETRFINLCTWTAVSNRRPLHAVRNCTTNDLESQAALCPDHVVIHKASCICHTDRH
jgi:hypothetical protein